MPDLRELFDSPEEGFRAMWAGIRGHLHTIMVSRVTKASDGHTVEAQPTVQQAVQDPTLTQTTYLDYPLVLDSPVHFPGGAGAVLTHGLAIGDEVATLFAENAIDAWHTQGGTAQPISDRKHSLSDGITIPGIRSDPRKLQQVAPDAMHMRSEDKTAVHEMKPGVGMRSFHADPSTPPASPTFDPLSQATKFVHHLSQSGVGAIGEAVDGGTTHSHGSFHGIGSWLKAMAPSGLVQALAHPDLGGLLSSADGKHTVQAHPEQGVMVNSATAVSISAPPGMMSLSGLASGSIGGSALAAGAASQNVGALSGDVTGTLPSVQVVALGHVDGRALPAATSDAAAAAAGVPVGGLYRDTSVASGKTVIVMRAA